MCSNLELFPPNISTIDYCDRLRRTEFFFIPQNIPDRVDRASSYLTESSVAIFANLPRQFMESLFFVLHFYGAMHPLSLRIMEQSRLCPTKSWRLSFRGQNNNKKQKEETKRKKKKKYIYLLFFFVNQYCVIDLYKRCDHFLTDPV